MLRENIPIKTCDEIKNSIKGCPVPCNDNERIEGNVIYETYYHWQSHAEAHGQMKSWYSDVDETEILYYSPVSRVGFRIDDFLDELFRTGYYLKYIRYYWGEPLVSRLFPTNAYIYDDRPVDVAALSDECEFLDQLIKRMSDTRDARVKAILRYNRRKEQQQSKEEPVDAP
ncbi:hypothetical protein [uncultured Roseobacter sp.]|uniref:hypothetical protein n=1 Tax=uncultured Roseobacter sp. TaxID=114847 RepID=UPI00262789C7|nr:hypothetical protein [uncultured Roseobacter sp.]